MALSREIPPLSQEQLPWSLLSVAQDVTPSGDHWPMGVSWRAANLQSPTEWDPHCSEDEPVMKTLEAEHDLGESKSVVLYLPYICPTAGPHTDADVQEAKKRLEGHLSAGVEKFFWTWALSNTTSLSVTGTASAVVAELAHGLAKAGFVGAGMIHMPSWAGITYLDGTSFDGSSGNAPRTARGDHIVIGAGYGGAGNVDRNLVIATGPVGYMVSNIEVYESPEHVVKDNRRVLLAEAYVSLQVDSVPVVSATISS